MTEKIPEICAFCDYNANGETGNLAECRRHAPAVFVFKLPGKAGVNFERTLWPAPQMCDGCGDFRPRQKK